jgi:hypothetical protein
MMHVTNRSIRFLSSLFLVGSVALSGCTADTAESEDASQIEMTTQALHGSSIGPQLVGAWKDSDGAFPTLDLQADGSYALDTGIRCITTPCPSGESGVWFLYRAGAQYYVSLLSDAAHVSWYRVRLVDGAPTSLVGAFGTSGSFLKQRPFCVEWETTPEADTPYRAFYAQDVKTREEGEAILAPIRPHLTNEAIREGACATQPQICTRIYAPVCGQVFSEPEETYGNLCEMKVAIRERAGFDGSAKGRWIDGACAAATAPFCGGIAGLACPGLGSCVDNPSDGCDPDAGGADCGGVCQCDALAKCLEGYVFDSSPEVCTCVAG